MCEGIKKHTSQLTSLEVSEIQKRLNNSKPKLSYHVKEQMIKRGISKEQVYNTLDEYEIIEFHRREDSNRKYIDNRVLIRNKKSIDSINTCISISLDTGNIITVYVNKKSDKHKTLDDTNYCEDLDVLSCLNNKESINYKNFIDDADLTFSIGSLLSGLCYS